MASCVLFGETRSNARTLGFDLDAAWVTG